MSLLGSFVLLAFLVGLVVLGMLVNLYFYLSGAFKKRVKDGRRLRAIVPQGVAEEQFTMKAPASDEMGSFVRRLVFTSVGVILIVLALVAALIASALH